MKPTKSAILVASLFVVTAIALPQTDKSAQEKRQQVMQALHLMGDSAIANAVMDYIVSNDGLRAMMVDKLEKDRSPFTERKAQASAAAGSGSIQEKGDIIIKFKADAQDAQIRAMMSEIGLQEVKRIPNLRLNVYKITSGKSIESVIEHCHKHSFVEYAEPNYTYKTQE